jgi:uncharacterized protein DUF3574
MRPLAAVFAAASLVLAAPSALACPQGLKPAMAAELFFGRAIGDSGGLVSDADWNDFLANAVTPNFPDGLTVGDVYGQWRGPDGRFVREPSEALFIVLPSKGGERQRLDLVRDAYKRRFHQSSVLLVEHQACVSF